MKDWTTISDAKEIYGKSETTMRNLVRKLKASKSKSIKIEKSENGRDIILIKRSYLDSQYDISTDREIDSVPDRETKNDIVDFLKQQIEIKDIQIDQKDKQINQLSHLLHQEKENVKMLMLQSGSADKNEETYQDIKEEKPIEEPKNKGLFWIVLLVLVVVSALVWAVVRFIDLGSILAD